jgi:hypothetical protein
MRTHGWKIHVAATVSDARSTLEIVGSYCVANQVAFKHLRSPQEHLKANLKQAERSGSGKFITIYPRSDEEFSRTVQDLNSRLSGRNSPYVLSDLRYCSGPVYFRYGSYIALTAPGDRGEDYAAIPGAEGVLVKDQRSPGFVMPKGVHVPLEVEEAFDAYSKDESSALDDYSALVPLHFSNSGGVYKATSENGRTHSVIKEARPFAGLDLRGRDAVTRLEREAENLGKLHEIGLSPRIIRTFRAWEHFYVEMEFLDYPTLAKWRVTHYPFGYFGNRPANWDWYTRSAMSVGHSLVTAVDAAHRCGIVIGDIHPGNVMVADDLSVRLIDLEDCRGLDSDESSAFNALGFLAPEGFTPVESDWFSTARTLLSLFVGDHLMELICPEYWETAIQRVRETYGDGPADLIAGVAARHPSGPACLVPSTPLDAPSLGRDILPPLGNGHGGLDTWKTALIEGIETTRDASPGQLYPGDISQQTGLGHINIESGAAGVILALGRAGAKIDEPTSRWLAGQALTAARDGKTQGGLFTGLGGVATAAYEAGDRETAAALMQVVTRGHGSIRASNLGSGLSGVGLCLLAYGLETEDERFVAEAVRIGTVLEDRLFADRCEWATGPLDERAGLLEGWSGVSLLWAALAHGGIDPVHNAQLAWHAIQRDMAHTDRSADGVLGVIDGDGGRTLPYLGWGTAGILVAVSALRKNPGFEEAAHSEFAAMVKACACDTYVFTGLLRGSAGLLAALGAAREHVDGYDALVRMHVEALRERALKWKGTVQFAGDYLLRLSSDFGTGAAGVLLSIESATGDSAAWVPVINPGRVLGLPGFSHSTGDRR